jgi:hypothetical protein
MITSLIVGSAFFIVGICSILLFKKIVYRQLNGFKVSNENKPVSSIAKIRLVIAILGMFVLSIYFILNGLGLI